MNFKKTLAAFAASAVAASAISVAAFAVDAHTGKAGYAAIAFAGGDWNAQYWLDGNEYASIASDVVVTGAGTYTVTMEAKSAYVDEETGEDAVADGTSDLAFAALQIEEGETLFPGIIITIDSVKFDGVEAALNGTPYTSSDDGVTTRVNLYNEWVGTIPDDARTIDGLAADATPKALNNAFGEWTNMEVTFTVTTGDAAEEAEEAEEEDVAAEEEAPAAEKVVVEAPAATGNVDAAVDSSKGSPDTGVADVAAVAGLALVAGAAIVVAKKRK